MYDAYLYSKILTCKWHIEPDIPLLFSKAFHCLPFKCGTHMRDSTLYLLPPPLHYPILLTRAASDFWAIEIQSILSVCWHPHGKTCLDKTQMAKAVPLASSFCADDNSSTLGCGLAWWPWTTSEKLGGSGPLPLSSWHCRMSYLHSQMPEGDLILTLHSLVYNYTELKLNIWNNLT